MEGKRVTHPSSELYILLTVRTHQYINSYNMQIQDIVICQSTHIPPPRISPA